MAETFHKGTLPAAYSGIDVSEKNIIVTAVKKHEDGDSTVIRCYESENIDTDVTISVFGKKIETHFSHNEVKTFIVGDDNIRQTDFIEW